MSAKVIHLNFYFISADSYDENVNIRSFGYDAMWGSIGGYVGMVLGISLFQLPDILFNGFQQLKSLKRTLSKRIVLDNEIVKSTF